VQNTSLLQAGKQYARLDSKILTSERCFWFAFVSFAREQVHKRRKIWGNPSSKMVNSTFCKVMSQKLIADDSIPALGFGGRGWAAVRD